MDVSRPGSYSVDRISRAPDIADTNGCVMRSFGTICVTFAGLLAGQVGVNGPRAQPEQPDAPMKTQKERAFESLDTDKNGVLTRTEFLAGRVGKVATAKLEEFETVDTDHSSGIDLEEFKAYRPPPPTPQQRAQRFQYLDKDANGKLTLEELQAGQMTDKLKRLARRHFVHWDADRDKVLSLKEFQRRGEGVQLTPADDFQLRDENGDGKLNETEFMRPNLGNPWEARIRRNFTKFDLDEDHFLSLAEFQLIPHQKPDAQAYFEGLDTDHNGKLDRREFVRVTPENQFDLAQRLFDDSDVNHDDSLDETEYRAYTKALAWVGWKSRFWAAAEKWGVFAMIVLDIALLAYIVHGARQILKTKHRQRSLAASGTQLSESALAPPISSPDDAPSPTPLETPESLDEFHIE